MDDDPRLFQSKRQRTLTPKGKEKMGEASICEDAVCGICLSDGGTAARGRIDSCDHYFCFICIMEWAKVESRCPLCKRRFRSIRRPELSGHLTYESVLEIPVRDQVYHPLGNESSALGDPYAEVNCRVCHGSNDDELLLLCDLCDSAFHTYCADLGYTVPEGDWYCHDCTILREEHTKINEDANDRGQNQPSLVPKQHQPVSIFDIVADEESSAIESFEQEYSLGRAVTGRSANLERNFDDLMLHAERTLQHPCNMQSRIQALRKNWNALRSGSLSFSSTMDSNGKERNIRSNSGFSQQSKSSDLFNTELPTDSSSSSKRPSLIGLQDVDKAWKMMQKAKDQRFGIPNKSSLSSQIFNKSIRSASAVSASRGNVYHSLNYLIPNNKVAVDMVSGCSTSRVFKEHSTKVTREGHTSDSFKTSKPPIREFSDKVNKVLPLCPSKLHEAACSSLSSVNCDTGRKSLWHKISNNNAKSEIQSIVKLNLQQLSKGQRLDSRMLPELPPIPCWLHAAWNIQNHTPALSQAKRVNIPSRFTGSQAQHSCLLSVQIVSIHLFRMLLSLFFLKIRPQAGLSYPIYNKSVETGLIG